MTEDSHSGHDHEGHSHPDGTRHGHGGHDHLERDSQAMTTAIRRKTTKPKTATLGMVTTNTKPTAMRTTPDITGTNTRAMATRPRRTRPPRPCPRPRRRTPGAQPPPHHSPGPHRHLHGRRGHRGRHVRQPGPAGRRQTHAHRRLHRPGALRSVDSRTSGVHRAHLRLPAHGGHGRSL